MSGGSSKSENKPYILVTGGAGYVGTHVLIELLKEGYPTVVVDNLVNVQKGNKQNGKPRSLIVVENISGKTVPFFEIDIQDKNALRNVFNTYSIKCVIHCASFKAVGESCERPLDYYENNVTGSIALLQIMRECGVKKLVFSSSSTVYGNPVKIPADETQETGNCTNPYGRTKYFIEEIARDVCKYEKDWSALMLRYFNPVGAHESGLLGEAPPIEPRNLVPFISQVAIGKKEKLFVFGGDYDTTDGTGIRDYTHITDIAEGHILAVNKIMEPSFKGWDVYNFGLGHGCTVLQVVQAYSKACGRKIPYEIVGRRAGDIPHGCADPSKATKELNWKPKKDLNDMCADAWRWQSMNPNGFDGPVGDSEIDVNEKITNGFADLKNGLKEIPNY